MHTVAVFVAALVVLLHLYFMVLEMFYWTRPLGRRVFRLNEEFAYQSRLLAANQGLYNGFLAVGLAWGLAMGPAGHGIQLFFLGCVICAGVFGAATVGRRILWVQAAPATAALLLLLATR